MCCFHVSFTFFRTYSFIPVTDLVLSTQQCRRSMRDNSSPLICSSEGILAGGEQEIEVESQMGNYILQSRWSKLIWSQLFCSVEALA